MRRGTTPTHSYELPFNTSYIKDLRIIYSQDDVDVLIKTKDECNCSGSTVSVDLTQTETFMFSPKKPVKIQLRVLTNDKQALTSDPIEVSCAECLSNEVIV